MHVPANIRKASPFLVFAAALALYLSTLAPGMLRGDSGEFQWAMVSLNVAHATGYPLFTLLGYAWQLLPISGNVAWQLNLLSPVFGALAVASIFLCIRESTAQFGPALVGAMFFALSPVMWFNASILEVYSLHAWLLALLLYLLLLWSRAPTRNGILYRAFFVYGLALAHHRLSVLALPALVYSLFATDRRFLSNLPRLLVCLLLLVPGSLLYLYVPLRLVPAGFSLEFAVNDIILGREYAASLNINPDPLRVLVGIPLENFSVGILLAVIGGVALFRVDRHWNIALWLVFLVDVGFALLYTVPDIEVFLTSSFVVTALWIGSGTAFLVSRAGERFRNRLFLRPALILILALIPLLNLIRYPEIRTAVAAEAAPEERARAIAAADLPQSSSLELDWETATALRFLQSTASLRPDLDARLIQVNNRDDFWNALARVDKGQAVFVEGGVKWLRAPVGYVTRAVVNDLAQILPAAAEITPVNGAVSDRIELEGYSSSPAAFVLYWRVLEPLERDVATFVHYLDADGNKIGQDDHAPCCEAVYGYRTTEWEPGRVYADAFSPPPPSTSSFLIGMYEIANGEIEPYGETLIIRP
jgi:hypothetical protein